jgi:hypothetical protein
VSRELEASRGMSQVVFQSCPTTGGFSLRSLVEPLKRTPNGGRLAQLVERFVYTEDVGGSSPSSPTIQIKILSCAAANYRHRVATGIQRLKALHCRV